MNRDSEISSEPVRVSDRRAQQRLERRQAILAAAIPLFAVHRANEVSMEEIARAAEVATGTLYTYFPNKEELFQAATERLLSSFHPPVMAILSDASRPPLERLRVSLLTKHEHIERHRTFFESIHHLGLLPAILCQADRAPGDAPKGSCAALIAEFMAATAACVAEAQSTGELRDDIPAETLAEALRSLSRGLTEARHARGDSETSIPDHAGLIFDLFHRGAAPIAGSP